MASKQIYQVFADNPLTPGLTDLVPFQPNDAGATEMGANTWQAVKDLFMPYKIYRALISQTGTSAPTAVILENTLGQVPTFAFASTGTFTLNVTGSILLAAKTFITPQWSAYQISTNVGSYAITRGTDAQINIVSTLNGTVSNAILTNVPLEIIVYN